MCITKEGNPTKEIRFKIQQAVDAIEDEPQDTSKNDDSLEALQRTMNKTIGTAALVQKRMSALSKSGATKNKINQSISTTIIISGMV